MQSHCPHKNALKTHFYDRLWTTTAEKTQLLFSCDNKLAYSTKFAVSQTINDAFQVRKNTKNR